jgi:hypothetical protein
MDNKALKKIASNKHLRTKENKEKLETKKTSQMLNFLAVMKIICVFSNKILKQKYFFRVIKIKIEITHFNTETAKMIF